MKNQIKVLFNKQTDENKWLLIKSIGLFIFLIESHMLYAYFVDSNLARAIELLYFEFTALWSLTVLLFDFNPRIYESVVEQC